MATNTTGTNAQPTSLAKRMALKAKIAKAYAGGMEELIVMSIFKVGFTILPTSLADKLAS